MIQELETIFSSNDSMKSLNLHDIREEGDTATIVVSVPDSFKEKFKQDQNMKRFTKKRFKSWVVSQLSGFEEVG